MRNCIRFAAILAALSVTSAGLAQTKTFGGANPSQITNVPIDTSKTVTPAPSFQLTNPRPFSLTRWFGSLFGASSNQVVGKSQMPSAPKGFQK